MHNLETHLTSDGSSTLYSHLHKAHYHSLNGAFQESKHIFIENGFDSINLQEPIILEVGLGTGLNAALTAYYALMEKRKVVYKGVDLYPIDEETIRKLNYSTFLPDTIGVIWEQIVFANWNSTIPINEYFTLTKTCSDFTQIILNDKFDIVYFDAFAPEDQPEMWTFDIFQKLYNAMSINGIIATYCSKGIVKQALRQAGFTVTRLAGPPGKRHMIRATKN